MHFAKGLANCIKYDPNIVDVQNFTSPKLQNRLFEMSKQIWKLAHC